MLFTKTQSVCNEIHIGKTRRNARIRWDEHEDPKKESEQVKHFRYCSDHSFFWKILLPAPANNHVRKITEVSMITLN